MYKLSNALAMKQAEEQYEEQEISYRNFTDKIPDWIINRSIIQDFDLRPLVETKVT